MHTGHIKVLHVIARFNVGGTAKYLSSLLSKFQDLKVDTLLVVGQVQTDEVEDSALTKLNFKRIEFLGRRISPINDLKAYLALRRIVKEFQPDIIHSHTFKAGLLCRIMFFGTPKIHTYHGHLLTDPEFSKSQIKVITFVERVLAKKANKLIVTGNQVAKDLLALKVGKTEQYLSIPGELENKVMLSKIEAREVLALEDSFIILWVARIAPVKQPELFVEVARLCPDFTFVMCGDGGGLESIRAVAPFNLKITGMVDPKNYFAAADVFVSTSANDGIPFSILEAQAAGLPVIAVDSGAIPEIIHDGVNGYLTSSNASEIRNHLYALHNNAQIKNNFGNAALAKSISQSLNPQITKLHQQAYLEVMRVKWNQNRASQ